jgi:YhcH/YjgK/YiaL family protein
MILDQLHRLIDYAELHRGIAMVDRHIRDGELQRLVLGRHELASGISVGLDQYDSKASSEIIWETHRQFIDIQVVLRGRERLLWRPLQDDLPIHSAYDAEYDRTFYALQDEGDGFVLMSGLFAIFFPGDVHAPSLRVDPGRAESVYKAVYKLPIEMN